MRILAAFFVALLLTIGLVAPASGATVAGLPGYAGVIPIDETFRYPDYNLFAHLHPDLNAVNVGVNFTMADAVRTAEGTWNNALSLLNQTPIWNWTETGSNFPLPPYPHIHFRMSIVLPGGVEELDEPDEDYSDIDEGDNGRGAPGNALAFFRILTQICGDCVVEAEIVFNRNANWGLAGAMTYDPIIVALHEMGHAMRLDHYTDANDKTINGNGVVMRPIIAAGAHMTNPNNPFGYVRFPSSLDIFAAGVSASIMDPCPEPAGFFSVAGGIFALTVGRFLAPRCSSAGSRS